MINFESNKHNKNLYNTLLILARDIIFYKKIGLPDTFETRLYLMFFYFSIILINYKMKNLKFSQKTYDHFFNNIEYNLRESGLGDITVNKKMKEFNKIFYDILIKLNLHEIKTLKFEINDKLIFKYFPILKDNKSTNYKAFRGYFKIFFDFCFEQSPDNMINNLNKFKY